jgi:hypothetical protein
MLTNHMTRQQHREDLIAAEADHLMRGLQLLRQCCCTASPQPQQSVMRLNFNRKSFRIPLSGVLWCRNEGPVICYITNLAVADSTPPYDDDLLASKQIQITFSDAEVQ